GAEPQPEAEQVAQRRVQDESAVGLITVQVQRHPEKHRLDGDKGHQYIAPDGQRDQTIGREIHTDVLRRSLRQSGAEGYGNSVTLWRICTAPRRHFTLPASKRGPRGPHTTSTILPMCRSDSISLWASAASASGKREWITGFRPRAANSGHTFSRSALARRPLLCTGCDRRVDAVIVRRFVMSGRRSSSALVPPCVAISAIRPSSAAAATLRAR